MRKLFPMLLFTLLLALLMAFPALAADFTYDDFSATLTVPRQLHDAHNIEPG